jgi:hypothetical protein
VIKKRATKARKGINPFTKEPTIFKGHHMRFVDADTLEGAEDESGYFEENPYDFPDDGTTDDEQLRDVTPNKQAAE